MDGSPLISWIAASPPLADYDDVDDYDDDCDIDDDDDDDDVAWMDPPDFMDSRITSCCFEKFPPEQN